MHEKQREALKTIKSYVWLTGAAALIPIHYLDLATISGLQLKMLAKISKIYDVPFQENLGKAAIASLAGSAIPHAAAAGTIGSLLKAIPGMGGVAAAPLTVVFAGAYSWALGNMFIQHFESGGTFLNFNPKEVEEYFKTQFEEAKKIAPAAV